MMDIIKIALSQYGITETQGPENNPEIMKYFHETGRKWVSNDETPWCDAFMDWCAMKAGLKFSPGLNARGWLEMGEEVKREDVARLILEIPIICIFWRGSIDSKLGHVGLVPRINETATWSLGGNQGIGQVNIHLFLKYRELGFRRLWDIKAA